MSFQTFDTTGSGYPGMGGGWFGGQGFGGAFAGGLAGGVIGDLLFDRNGRDHGCRGSCSCGHGCGPREVIQINENGGRRGWGDADLFIMKELFDVHYNQATQTEKLMSQNFQALIANNTQLSALAKEICCSTNSTQREIAEAKFQNALQLCGISREMAECCCKQLMETMKMGFETQLRDQANTGMIMGEILKTQCMIKDAEKDGIIRGQKNELEEFRMQAIINTITGRLGIGVNQIGVNQVNTAPTTSQWPPAIFAPGSWT